MSQKSKKKLFNTSAHITSQQASQFGNRDASGVNCDEIKNERLKQGCQVFKNWMGDGFKGKNVGNYVAVPCPENFKKLVEKSVKGNDLKTQKLARESILGRNILGEIDKS